MLIVQTQGTVKQLLFSLKIPSTWVNFRHLNEGPFKFTFLKW